MEMSLSISLCHTDRGWATNGLFFQSFLAGIFFFVCALSSIHLFMSPFSSPFLFLLPSLLPFFLFFLSYCPHTPTPHTHTRTHILLPIDLFLCSLSVYLSCRPCSSCTQLNLQPCRCPRGQSSTEEACPHKPTWAHTPHPPTRTHRVTRAAAHHHQTRPR